MCGDCIQQDASASADASSVFVCALDTNVSGSHSRSFCSHPHSARVDSTHRLQCRGCVHRHRDEHCAIVVGNVSAHCVRPPKGQERVVGFRSTRQLAPVTCGASQRREVVKVAGNAKVCVELFLGTRAPELVKTPRARRKHVVRPAIGGEKSNRQNTTRTHTPHSPTLPYHHQRFHACTTPTRRSRHLLQPTNAGKSLDACAWAAACSSVSTTSRRPTTLRSRPSLTRALG